MAQPKRPLKAARHLSLALCRYPAQMAASRSDLSVVQCQPDEGEGELDLEVCDSAGVVWKAERGTKDG